jgi:chromosome partitioning protein
MLITAVSNQKGGTGKTTTAVNLSASLADKGKKVLLIDLDPQASATKWVDGVNATFGINDVITSKCTINDAVSGTSLKNLSLIKSSTWLASAEKILSSEVGAEIILREKIKLLEPKWDYCLIDCPPSLGLMTISALSAVDKILVPVETSVMALDGLANLISTIKIVTERLNPNLSMMGVVACMVDTRRRLDREVVASLRKTFGKVVFDTVIRENVKLSEAWSYKQPINVFAPSSHGASDYGDLATEFIKKGKKS